MSMEFHRSYTRENGLWKRSVLYILNWDTPSLKYLTITVTLDIRKTSGLAWRFFVGCNVVNPIRNHSQWLTISVDRLSNHTISVSGSSGKTWQYFTSGDFPWFPTMGITVIFPWSRRIPGSRRVPALRVGSCPMLPRHELFSIGLHRKFLLVDLKWREEGHFVLLLLGIYLF